MSSFAETREIHQPAMWKFSYLRALRSIDGWRLVTLLLALLVALPLSVILLSFTRPEPEIWRHMADYLLIGLLKNTLILTSGVLGLTLILGTGLAWLTVACEFPGRKIFSWALLLPLAMPTYVLAFVFLGVLDFSGPVQSLLRAWFPAAGTLFPNVRSAGGVILVMSLALYPYVYLLSKNAFMTQGKQAMEAARSLGYSPTRAFIKVSLPMARPWIAGGLLLVLMETLADFGAVSIFNFDTFTTAIYKAWFGFFSLNAAAQLSSVLVLIVFVVMIVEQKTRSNMRYTHSGRAPVRAERIRLSGWRKWGAFLIAFGVLAAAFLIPLVQLAIWSAEMLTEQLNARYFGYLARSLLLSLLAASIICASALLLTYTGRRHKDRFTGAMIRIAILGYALPGTVLAVGLVIVISFIDGAFVGLTGDGSSAGPLLQGTVFTMIIAYLVRFMAGGYNSINSAMQRITPNMDEAAISMGVKGVSLLRRVHVPLLKGGILTAGMLVFVDVMKEMPITLMTRPFGWDTLAVKIYELTSEGEWERAALPAVILVLGGLIPIILLNKQAEA